MWWTRARGFRPCSFTARSEATSMRRGAVGDLAGDGGGEPAALVERLRAWPSSRGWCRGAAPRPSSTLAEGHDLVLEATLVDGRERARVALEREALHVLAARCPTSRRSSRRRGTARPPGCRSAPTQPFEPENGIVEAERLGQRSWPTRSGSGSCSARRRRRPGRWCRSSRPGPRSAPPAGTSRTGGRWSRPARARAGPRRASRCGRCRRPAGRWCRQQPKITSSTAPGSTPVRSTSALMTWAPRSAGWTVRESAAALADGRADGVDDDRPRP